MDRRDLIRNLSVASATPFLSLPSIPVPETTKRKFQHSVCRWCYKNIPLEELCDIAKDCDVQSIELLYPDEWDVVLDHGLKVALSNGSSLGIPKGFNDLQYHAQLQTEIKEVLYKAAEKGIPQVIVFSGNRNGIADQVAIENCARGLSPLVSLAEEVNVTIVMELLNSKINHPDYQCDHTSWGRRLVDMVNSPNFKLLYDIYHMQIMEGDVIHTITENKDYFAHYHTGGVPGRHEINETQELNYRAIMNAIADNGFTGYVAQEFVPVGDPKKALKEAIKICSV